MRPSRAPEKGKGSVQSDGAHRDRRLGKGARRDVKWALRQNPGDNVGELWVHGVKITYVAKKDAARDEGERRGAQKAEKSPPVEKTAKKNSRQRRSERRAKKYFAMKKASENQTLDEMTERAMATGQYPPPPSPAPRTALSGQDASATDDVSMADASGSGRGKGEKVTTVHLRSGRGRGGSK